MVGVPRLGVVMKQWNELTIKEKVRGVLVLALFVGASVMTWVAFDSDCSLSNPIDRKEAIRTCVNAYKQGSWDYSFSDKNWSHSVEMLDDAWAIRVKGVVRDFTGLWMHPDAYCEVPFERTDKEKTRSTKNIRKFEYLLP